MNARLISLDMERAFRRVETAIGELHRALNREKLVQAVRGGRRALDVRIERRHAETLDRWLPGDALPRDVCTALDLAIEEAVEQVLETHYRRNSYPFGDGRDRDVLSPVARGRLRPNWDALMHSSLTAQGSGPGPFGGAA